jgi:hypothetical protein
MFNRHTAQNLLQDSRFLILLEATLGRKECPRDRNLIPNTVQSVSFELNHQIITENERSKGATFSKKRNYFGFWLFPVLIFSAYCFPAFPGNWFALDKFGIIGVKDLNFFVDMTQFFVAMTCCREG